jgi:hypothetical protein
MPNRVLNLEPSSGAFSTGAFEGVAALDTSFELRADAVADAGWALSTAWSAMGSVVCFFGTVASMEI